MNCYNSTWGSSATSVEEARTIDTMENKTAIADYAIKKNN